MSTRALIARQTNDGWEGVYQHSDGYPTGLGRELRSVLHHKHDGNVPAFLNAVIDAHPGGWSYFTPAIPAELECGRNFERATSLGPTSAVTTK